MKIPQHIAIIPDGNRRWAKKRALGFTDGYRQGVKTVKEILEAAQQMKIPNLTFWGCSVDNILKRSRLEVNFLFKIFEEQFRKMAENEEIKRHQVQINVLGGWEKYFPEKTKQAIKMALALTKNHRGGRLNFLLAYSGAEEMINVIQEIAAEKTKSPKLRIDKKTIKNHLLTKDMPAVDLLIRTGGEPHFSDGFMMWDIADAQMYFTDTLWPDFSAQELQKAISFYQKSERRLGK